MNEPAFLVRSGPRFGWSPGASRIVSPVDSGALKKSQVPAATFTKAIWFCQPMFWALVSPEMKHLKSTANSTGNAVRIAGSGTETGGTSPAIQAFSLRAQLEQGRRNR
jgi:hypothetical protein